MSGGATTEYNSWVGDALTKSRGMKFRLIVGNPPYNSPGKVATGNTIWQDFVKISMNDFLIEEGYLVFVHPPGWRKPNTKRSKFVGLWELLTRDNQLEFLSIHDTKDGMKTFNAGTRYDWYLVRKTPRTRDTLVRDDEGKILNVDTSKFSWLPNSCIEKIQSLLGGGCPIIYSATSYETRGCNIIYDRSIYGSDRKDVSTTENDEFKYPVVHTIPKTGVRYLYSKVNDRGHFGVSKVIFGDNGLNDVIIDMEGKYGTSENSMSIQVSSLEEAENIKKCLLSTEFKNVIKSCLFSSFRIDWRLFQTFKKDFWKEFV